MQDKVITVFNMYENKTADTAVWYPHTISGVSLYTDRGAIIKKYGNDSADNAELHIPYTDSDSSKIITDADGNSLPWLPPKEWKAQTIDALAESITFDPAQDFFIEGTWDGGVVSEDDYKQGFYAYINNKRDFCYKITSVGGPYTLIPHFEILAK